MALYKTELSENINFWYTKKAAYCFFIPLFVLISFLSSLVPPFQAPDEFHHVQRAYLVSEGNFFYDKGLDNTSGSMIDQGLRSYMSDFENIPFHYDAKIDLAVYNDAKSEIWRGKDIFMPFTVVPIYGPWLYLPQATGLKIGKSLNLTIHHSYLLARLCILVCSFLLIIWAANIFPIPPIAIALLITPMSLFQLGSTSPDGLTFASSVLFLTSFSLAYLNPKLSSTGSHIALFLSSLLLITSKYYFFPIIFTPIILYKMNNKNIHLVIFSLLFFLIIVWVLIIKNLFKGPSNSINMIDICFYYLKNPLSLLKVIFNTIFHYGTIRFILYSLIGKLGWLDAPINGKVFYTIPSFYLAYLTYAKSNINEKYVKLILSFVFLFVFLLLTLLLISWTPHPAIRVTGLQGRYFIPIVMFLAFAKFNSNLKQSNKYYLLISTLLITSFCLSYLTILHRYWTN